MDEQETRNLFRKYNLEETSFVMWGSEEASEEFRNLLAERLKEYDIYAWVYSDEDRHGKAYNIYCETHSDIQKKYLGHPSY